MIQGTPKVAQPLYAWMLRSPMVTPKISRFGSVDVFMCDGNREKSAFWLNSSLLKWLMSSPS